MYGVTVASTVITIFNIEGTDHLYNHITFGSIQLLVILVVLLIIRSDPGYLRLYGNK